MIHCSENYRNRFITFVVCKSKVWPNVGAKGKVTGSPQSRGVSLLEEYTLPKYHMSTVITSGNIIHAKLTFLAKIGAPIMRGLCIFNELCNVLTKLLGKSKDTV